MIPPYEIFLRSEAIDSLRRLRSSPRKRVSQFIDSLALDPFAEGDYALKDPSDRDIHIKVVGEYAVSFWTDHPAKEIKIIDIRSADRA
jgi:mRNA-degrading endonuclease RelE of RelBE toxin-antitoxin system